jgi:methyltransferase (TIGR00027 family)
MATAVGVAYASGGSGSMPSKAALNARVKTPHSFTARMCAASRLIESRRPDSIFYEPEHISAALAGDEGLASPMGEWIMVPRTRFGDDFLYWHFTKRQKPCRQLVLLGAGMDARAYRLDKNVYGRENGLVVFEVDQQTTFDVKEPLLANEELRVTDRVVVPYEFTEQNRAAGRTWGQALIAKGFDVNVPTVWLLEGLLMYLSMSDTKLLMEELGKLSAPGSAVFHDAVSESYVAGGRGPVVGGAPFIGGSDDYLALWRRVGFAGNRSEKTSTRVYDFSKAMFVDRPNRRLLVDDSDGAQATPHYCYRKNVVLFVTAEKAVSAKTEI